MINFFDLKEEVLKDRDEIIAAITDVIDSGWYIMGKRLTEFEGEFAQYIGVKHALGVANGLDALILPLRAKGIGEGDEVIVPAQTFIATWLAVSATGATLIPVDVDPQTCLLDPAKVRAAVTPRTKAIIPVHLFGHSVDIDGIVEACERDDVFILEDSAQAHGGTYKGKKCGNLGSASGFSFYPAKTLGALGDGGAVTTNDTDLFHKMRELRNYGSSVKYVHGSVGLNSRLDELQAAVLSVKLRRLEESLALRTSVAKAYDERLSSMMGVTRTPVKNTDYGHAYHLYVVRVNNRQAIMKQLQKQGISTQIHYPIAPYNQVAYKDLGFTAEMFPHANAWSHEALSLPFSPNMSVSEINVVCDALQRAVSN